MAVHARVRGDGSAREHFLAFDNGLPPRARGRRIESRTAAARPRFTPACAGTAYGPSPPGHPGEGSPPRARGRRQRRPDVYRTTPVHPRVRGDGAHNGIAGGQMNGSPPRARGRGRKCRLLRYITAVHPRVREDGAIDNRCRLAQRWFTPACAGTGLPIAAHALAPTGSPPRARGRETRYLQVQSWERFTPACAGTGLQETR